VLMVAVVPAAILAHAIRVTAIGLFPVLQEGLWQSTSGWQIFFLCFGMLLIINWGLNYLQPAPPGAATPTMAPDLGRTAAPQDRGTASLSPLLAVSLALIIMTGVLTQRASQVRPIPLLQSFDNFPLQLEKWHGRRSFIDPKIFQATGADYYLNVDYSNPERGEINLWIAYYENQKSRGAVHSPFSCLAGSGWRQLHAGILYLAPGYPVKYLYMDLGGKKMVVSYLYLQRGRLLTNEYLNKFFIGYDRLLAGLADGALVRLITPAEPDLAAAKERLQAFGKILIPLLPQFIKY